MLLNLEICENNLKKRVNEKPYQWRRLQNNSFDKLTNQIYRIRSYKQLLCYFKDSPEDIKNYAYNRWLNYWSAKCVEQIFASFNQVSAEKNEFHKKVDFYINDIPFDHKTTVIPNVFHKKINNIDQDETKIELIKWLYKNQSKEQREHYSNRIFVVLINKEDPKKSWKMKAEIEKIKSEIYSYMSYINNGQKSFFNFHDKKKNIRFSSDIIVVKN